MKMLHILVLAMLAATPANGQVQESLDSTYEVPGDGFNISDTKEAMRIAVPGLSGKKGDMIYAFAHLVGRKDVRSTLEIVGSQLSDLRGVGHFKKGEFEKSLEEYFRKEGIDQPTPEERAKAHDHVITAKYLESRNTVKEILLPHQVESLDELAYLAIRRELGLLGLLDSYWGQDELKLSEAELLRIRKRHQDRKENLVKQIEELKKKTELELLDDLTESQAAKVKQFLKRVDKHGRPRKGNAASTQRN